MLSQGLVVALINNLIVLLVQLPRMLGIRYENLMNAPATFIGTKPRSNNPSTRNFHTI